jgi:methyl-galactoside transport system substrate-binding protein
MKKALSILLATSIALSMGACSSGGTSKSVANTKGAESASQKATKKAGVCWYQFSDTFIANARQSLLNISQNDGTVAISDADSTNDQNVQDNNMNNFFTQGVDYLVLNNINTGGVSNIVNQCKQKGVITIFANTTSPSDKDFANYKNLWYVSSDSKQSGVNMGNAISEYIKAHSKTWDRNHNGKLDYILLQGMASFSDTINRSSYSLATIEKSGIKLGTCIGGNNATNVKGGDVINGVLCDFSRSKAQENVEALLANYGKDIDCVIADNDDEALGAIAALKAHGYFGSGNYIPVVGVDATAAGCEALKNGTLLETSLNNPVKLSKSIYKLMDLLTKGKEVTTESMNMDGVKVEGHRIWINYASITAKNLNDASYNIKDTKIN